MRPFTKGPCLNYRIHLPCLPGASLSKEQQGSARTIEPKSLTNLLASKKVRCSDSGYSPKFNGFSRFRASFKTCSEADVATSRHFNIDSSDQERSGIGNRQRVPAVEGAGLATTMD